MAQIAGPPTLAPTICATSIVQGAVDSRRDGIAASSTVGAMRIATLVLASAAVLALSACASTTSSPRPSPAATFVVSDSRALAAATKSFREYIAASDRIANAGAHDSAPIEPLVTKSQLAREKETFKYYTDRGLHSAGVTRIKAVKLESKTTTSQRLTAVIYACLNVQGVRIFDIDGQDVTSASRPVEGTLEVTLVSLHRKQLDLVVSGSEEWSGSGVC
jgi:hypothetical protein